MDLGMGEMVDGKRGGEVVQLYFIQFCAGDGEGTCVVFI